MGAKDFLRVLRFYQTYFSSQDITAKRIDHTQLNIGEEERLQHLVWMLGNMEPFINNRRHTKFCRWLGFLQGALWVLKHFTIEELRLHNKPRN